VQENPLEKFTSTLSLWSASKDKVSEVFCPFGESQFFQRTPGSSFAWELTPFGHICFLDKRRYFLGCLKIPSNHWAYIFGVKRKEAHMSQEKKEILKKNEKFEDGVLRADACMERYQSSRDSQYRTHSEDLPEQAFGLSALWEERNLMKNVYKLMAKGFKPNGSETLESFVEKHRDLLDEEVI